MNIAFLQCDLRFNRYLLDEIGGVTVVEHTINKVKKLDCKKIIAGVYNCKENFKLIEVLNKFSGIQLVKSNENNVNRRFMEVCLKENADYIIRVGADQVLLDVEKENEILREMQEQDKEFFYESEYACILADVVKLECLKKYKDNILQKERYFEALLEEQCIQRYRKLDSDILLYDFRVSSRETFRICKNIIENDLNMYDLSRKLAIRLKNKNNYLNKSGIWGSWLLAEQCDDFFYDEEGIVNPWMGRTVVDFLRKRLKYNMRVFEWGCGNSTLFWSHYVKEVVSVEHNYTWYEKMKKIVPENVNVQYCELEYGGEYCRKILENGQLFDIIVIDGRDRVNCAASAVKSLNPQGVIVWDNSERESYVQGYQMLQELGFKKIEFSSIIYGLPGTEDFTAIFYRDNNILEI